MSLRSPDIRYQPSNMSLNAPRPMIQNENDAQREHKRDGANARIEILISNDAEIEEERKLYETTSSDSSDSESMYHFCFLLHST